MSIESNPLACTFDQFKRMSKEFFDALPTLNLEEMDNAFKCLSLAYLSMVEDRPGEQVQAAIVLKIATRHFIQREAQLEAAAPTFPPELSVL
jgi:hypothetical protein